ncbi:MAG: collagenase [Spirochaetaceae bacterium]|nr:collagenase [Spirochaetaceae bacterium]
MKRILSIILFILPVLGWSDDFIGWNNIETEHYNFIFEEQNDKTAQELASYGEEIYKLVSNFFDSYPLKINVYINERIDSPNGFFYPIPGSINLYPVYPFNSENSTKSESWLYELLLHEMVHYISLENRKGFFGVFSYIFGKDLAAANGAFLPAWMVEGIAVYLETKYTEGGRGRNKYFEAFNKAAAIENNYYNIYQLAYSSDFPPLNRIYSGGYLLTNYLLQNYGEDIFQKIYLRYVKFPFFGPFNAIKKETGKSLKEIFEDLKSSENIKYESNRKIFDIFPSRKISPETISNWTHPKSTEQGTLLYKTEPDEKSAIVLINTDTGEEQILIETSLLDNSAFTSDSTGNVLAFAKGDYSLYHMYGSALLSNIYLYKDGKTRRLTEKQSLFQPALSNDGKKLIAVQRIGSYSRLVSIDLLSGSISVLFAKTGTNIMNPVFSPSSEKIAFVMNDHGYQDIFIMNTSEKNSAIPLFSIDIESEYYPRFINEDSLSFISDRDDDLSLFTYDLKLKELNLVFKDPVGVADGFLKNDKIYYTTYRTNGYEFHVGELNHIEQFPLNKKSEIPTSEKQKPIAVQNYIDWTIPYLWLPKLEIKMSSTEGIQTGLGAIVFAGSYGQSGEWIFNFNYTPGLGQLNGSFDFSQKLGTSTFYYNFEQTYNELIKGVYYIWRQSTNQSLALILPLFEQNKLNWRNVLQTYVSFSHKFQISDYNTFSFENSFSKNSENYLYAGTGLIYNAYKINYPRKSLFGDLSIFNRLDFTVQLPLLSSKVTSYILKDSMAYSLPLGPEGFLVQAGLQGAYHNKGFASQAVSSRGGSPDLVKSDFALLYTLDYFIPIALLDWGMPFGFNIQNLAAAIHFEGISHINFDGSATNQLFCGLEIIGTYGYNYGKIPAGMGINFRIYNQGEPFNPADDIRLYFFLSYKSIY